MSFIDYFAIFVLVTLLLSGTAIIIMIGMAPGYIAKKRNHPWAGAVEVAGWVTLICGFVFWPISLIWAYVDVPKREDSK